MSAPGQLRAQAARVLAQVLAGRSLKAVLGPAEARVGAVRDRALLHAIVLAGVRGTLRYRALLALLLQKPLPARATPVEAALVAAFAQIESLELPPHAVVAETVAAIRILGFPAFAGLGNALLRRWLREREALDAQLAGNDEARWCHPQWLLSALRQDWPEHWPGIVEVGNAEATMWLRVNRRQITREAFLQRLQDEGLQATAHPQLPDALRLHTPLPVTRLPGFADGQCSVQDASAQYAALLLDVQPGQRVLDACAAPGGKTGHLLECRPDVGELLALDSDAARLRRIDENLQRLQHRNPALQLRVGDAGDPSSWWDGRPFQRILLDAPCSATGIARRQPDVRLHRRAGDITDLAWQQARLLEALWPLLAPGGRLLYVVCSVLRAESQSVLQPFLAAHADARTVPLDLAGAHPLDGGAVQLLPDREGGDGFAYALLERS